MQIGKETVKISLIVDDMILYFKDPKNSTPKLLDTINSYIKLSGYKFNLQISLATPTMNKLRRNMCNNSTQNSLIKIKYLGVNLTKDVNDLDKENYKLLKKEIEEDYRRLKDLPCSWIGRINIVKIVYYQKQSTCLMQFPSKSQ
jgi:hypothetical protein